MGREAFQRRLAEIGMSQYDAAVYESFLKPVEREVNSNTWRAAGILQVLNAISIEADLQKEMKFMVLGLSLSAHLFVSILFQSPVLTQPTCTYFADCTAANYIGRY